MTERPGPCPYELCHHNHPELPRHWEAVPDLARDPQPEPAPEPETEGGL